MTDEKILVAYDTLVSELTALFIRHGVSPLQAEATCQALVASEAREQKGHGLSRVPSYLGQVRSGKVRADAAPKVVCREGAMVRIDAALGFAYPALDLAVKELSDLTKTTQIAIAAITNSHHAGVLGTFVEALADQGLVAMMFANTPKAMAPYGGNAAVFGTNPIGFAAPRSDGPPIVIDLALSRTARGKVMAAAQKGEAIPEGWALDAEGNPTTDPNKALEGTMLPIGDAKGAALALMVEVLAAALTGSTPSQMAASFLNEEGREPAVGQLIIAINPGPISGGLYEARIETIARAITDQPGARLAGETANRSLSRVEEDGGLWVDRAMLDRFNALLSE